MADENDTHKKSHSFCKDPIRIQKTVEKKKIVEIESAREGTERSILF